MATTTKQRHDTAPQPPTRSVLRHAEKKDGLSRERYFMVSLFGFLFVAMGIVNDDKLLVKYQEQVGGLNEDYPQGGYKEQEDKAMVSTRRFLRETVPSGEEYPLKCSPWDINIDTWWQMHPDWEPYNENETHTCFRPIQRLERAAFYREVYENQYHGLDCSEMRTRRIIGVGYAAAVGYLNSGFYSAFRHGRPFQVTKYREDHRWLYVPPYDPPAGTNRSWASCPSQDNFCYFLPISNCERQVGREEDRPDRRFANIEVRENQTRAEQHNWLKAYLTRPRQEVRRRLRKLIQEEAPVLDDSSPCTWIHVRRADAMTERRHPRNFYALSEYLKRGNVSTSDNILLLTDDQTTIEEAHLLHPEYKWNYWNRTRHRGAQKRNEHFPSKDEAREMLIVLAELQLAGKCTKGVHGTSNMVDMFQAAMSMEHRLANIELVSIDDDLKGTRVEPFLFLAELDAKLEAARNKTKRNRYQYK